MALCPVYHILAVSTSSVWENTS